MTPKPTAQEFESAIQAITVSEVFMANSDDRKVAQKIIKWLRKQARPRGEK